MITKWPRTYLTLSLFVCLFFLPQFSHAHDAVWPGEKLAKMYPGAKSFEQRNLYISSQQQKNIEKILGERLREEDLKPSIYFAIVQKDAASKPKRQAVLMFIDAQGENGLIETGLVMGKNGAIKQVLIFENNEDRALSSPSFLAQFTEKKAAQEFRVGRDISAAANIKGPAQAVASGARRGLLIINELFKKR